MPLQQRADAVPPCLAHLLLPSTPPITAQPFITEPPKRPACLVRAQVPVSRRFPQQPGPGAGQRCCADVPGAPEVARVPHDAGACLSSVPVAAAVLAGHSQLHPDDMSPLTFFFRLAIRQLHPHTRHSAYHDCRAGVFPCPGKDPMQQLGKPAALRCLDWPATHHTPSANRTETKPTQFAHTCSAAP